MQARTTSTGVALLLETGVSDALYLD